MASVINVRGFTASLVAIVAALVLIGATPATAPVPGETGAFAAVKHAGLPAAQASADRAEIERAVHFVRTLPSGRSEHVAVALEEVAAFDHRLTAPRALALFGQLKANDDYFSKHYAPADKSDITGDDGIVYRYFKGRCFEFHPLANFGALNALVAAGNVEGTEQLAAALVARGVHPKGGGVGYEYYFNFGGPAPWFSGMAQAVAAQAFAGAAALVPSQSAALMADARAAYQLIPAHLLTRVAAGPWIRLYAFSAMPVLNAQLQTVLSLESYAKAADDPDAAALAARLEHAAVTTLPRFNTGYWTYYSLDGTPSPLAYQQFVVSLLKKLAPLDQRFADAATQIAAYQHQPPAFMVANAGLGALRFWLSKPSSVHVVTGAGPAKSVSLGGGWHTLTWNEPKNAGAYPVDVSAVDWAGNRAAFQALPIVRVSTDATKVAARSTSDAGVTPPPAFAVGTGIDDPGQSTLARSLGLKIVRIGLAWPDGATAPDPGVVASLQQVPATAGLILELSGLPVDDPGRLALTQYLITLEQQVPNLHELLLAPTTDATDDAAAFAAIRAALPAVTLGVATDGSRANTLAIARALAAVGMHPDVVALHPGTASTSSLIAALAQTLGAAPPVLIDGLATPTTIPAVELDAYSDAAPPATGAVAATTQGSTYASAITSAACTPGVAGVILDRLVDDGTQPLPPTGLYYAGGGAKPSAALVRAAIAPAQRGIVVCPGLAVPAAASTLTFPVAPSSPLRLGCVRDCLYLVTLDGADGKPVVATRGALRGGFPPVLVTLPQAKLKAGSYRLDVRLVNQVNPGPVTQLLSPALASG